jgi:hypothetical protein
MRVMIVGDRSWADKHAAELVAKRMAQLPPDTEVYLRSMEGICELAAYAAQARGFPCMPADEGGSREALQSVRPDLVIAFHRNIKYSHRSAALVLSAIKLGIRVEVLP